MSEFGLVVDGLAPAVIAIRPRGDLDSAHAYVFDEELRRAEALHGESAFVLDLRGLDFIDSSGVRALLAARRRAARAGRRIVLIQGGPPVRRIMRLVGLEDAFEIADDVPPDLVAPADGAARSAPAPERA